MDRRRFLECSGIALLAEFLATPALAAAARHESAFAAGSPDSVYAAMGLKAPETTTAIVIEVPEIAENGGKVPVEVRIDLPNPERLLLIGEKNPLPLLADVQFFPKSAPIFETQIKLAETSRIRAVVAAGGRWYVTARQVRVIVGGCVQG